MPKADFTIVACAEELDLETFHFKGTHHPNSIEYNVSKNDYIESYGNIVSITFNDNKTFAMNVKLKCDSLSSVPACDSINFVTGIKEFSLEGSYDFEQHLETYGYGSWRANRMVGQCNLKVIESTNDMLNGETLTCETRIDCTPSTFNYWMNINIPIQDDDWLLIQISDERLK